MSCEDGRYDIVEPSLNLNPPIHTWATVECPHCGDFRHIVGYLRRLWDANEGDEHRYFMFHEPYQFLSDYWHQREVVMLRGEEMWKRNVYRNMLQEGQFHRIWGNGQGGWSKEYLELFGQDEADF